MFDEQDIMVCFGSRSDGARSEDGMEHGGTERRDIYLEIERKRAYYL